MHLGFVMGIGHTRSFSSVDAFFSAERGGWPIGAVREDMSFTTLADIGRLPDDWPPNSNLANLVILRGVH